MRGHQISSFWLLFVLEQIERLRERKSAKVLLSPLEMASFGKQETIITLLLRRIFPFIQVPKHVSLCLWCNRHIVYRHVMIGRILSKLIYFRPPCTSTPLSQQLLIFTIILIRSENATERKDSTPNVFTALIHPLSPRIDFPGFFAFYVDVKNSMGFLWRVSSDILNLTFHVQTKFQGIEIALTAVCQL